MREPFDSKAYYHVFNRGVEKRTIFTSDEDFRRFYESMYLFNDENYRHRGGYQINRDVLLAASEVLSYERKPHVKILAFCLLPNHFHLLLLHAGENGISRFLHKLSMGYANYFNLKYDRSGTLYEGKFKAKPVDYEEHLQIMPRYIHLNALDGTEYQWRAKQIADWDGAARRLEAYPWSSHGVYLGNGQLLPVVDEDAVRTWFPSPEDYKQYLMAPRDFGSEELTFSVSAGSESRKSESRKSGG